MPETVTIPAGTLVHIGGIPFRLTAAADAEGSQEALDRELSERRASYDRAWDNERPAVHQADAGL